MIEVSNGLFCGAEVDYHGQDRAGWRIVHACKEPFHRQALGYTGRGTSPSHPEYLVARRDRRLILNLIDPVDPKYVSKACVDAALSFIDEALAEGKTCLVHCNEGRSRAPTICLLSMANKRPWGIFAEARESFRSIYPRYEPSNGMEGFARANYEAYKDRK